ncbi:hypothetical protein PSEUBRA_005037 [Kalmanozyma brasiliensis GHG001]|uniref:Uncharacterized protein n=1 Tax=Kalmanozyma brasiliensis (strain GHG001) TaxID=1365824 RepID=V5GJ22_KALBG|nr:uncharacterized protein PSEUBRA_005037 [Kalmanozyma brasiliensis GHG001]EST05982.1 hypothetical protein PSEUBRA_005037 [Kalmanozyma brasiliensis GHG001]
MVHHRLTSRSVASWLTRISSKASDWVFGSVPLPASSEANVPKPAVGGVTVMEKMPYPYATGMVPRLASETLSGGGLVGGWMCVHVDVPVEDEDDGQEGAAGVSGANDGAGGGQQDGSGGAGGAGAGAGAGANPGDGSVGGGSQGFAGAGQASAGGAGVTGGGFNGNPNVGTGSGFAGQQQPVYNGGQGGSVGGAYPGSGYPGGAGTRSGFGDQQDTGAGGFAGGSDAGLSDSAGAGGIGPFANGGGVSGGSADINGGMGAGAGDQRNTNPTPGGYIRYRGQLLTIDQYQRALASSSSPLSRRDMLPVSSSSIFIDTLLHKRDGATSTPKVLMCINGDPALPPIKFNTMTGLRIRDASTQQGGVVSITNLPNYSMPWMPFLPTAEMWAEQQALMLEQESIIENNMTSTPPPSR